MSQQPFESWTRTEENEERTLFYESRARRRWSRGALALLGVTLILLSVGLVFADIRSVGEAEAVAPKSEKLKLTVPQMKRVKDIPVYDGAAGDKGKLAAGALHLEDTGFPWEEEANVYRVVLEDARGRRYVYEVFDKLVVGPNDASVKRPLEGKNIVTLQTCTLPNYKKRLVVQAELVS